MELTAWIAAGADPIVAATRKDAFGDAGATVSLSPDALSVAVTERARLP